jgi:hypothetical protein
MVKPIKEWMTWIRQWRCGRRGHAWCPTYDVIVDLAAEVQSRFFGAVDEALRPGRDYICLKCEKRKREQ